MTSRDLPHALRSTDYCSWACTVLRSPGWPADYCGCAIVPLIWSWGPIRRSLGLLTSPLLAALEGLPDSQVFPDRETLHQVPFCFCRPCLAVSSRHA